MGKLVLIIDADDIERRYIAAILAADGFDLVQTGSIIEGLVYGLRANPAVVVVAEQVEAGAVPAADVLPVLRRLTDAPVMVIGGGDGGEEASAFSGADYYLARPFRPAELSSRARMLARRADPAPGDRQEPRVPDPQWSLGPVAA